MSDFWDKHKATILILLISIPLIIASTFYEPWYAAENLEGSQNFMLFNVDEAFEADSAVMPVWKP